MQISNVSKNVAFIIGVFVVSLAGYSIFAWIEPSSTPPTPNVAAPINTGLTAQTKTGALNIYGNLQIGDVLGNSAGSGIPIYFSDPFNNTDSIWLGRYNNAADASQLRLNMGDDASSGDYFDIGYTLWSDGLWHSHMVVGANGNVGIGTTNPAGKLDIQGGSICLNGVCCSTWDDCGVGGTTCTGNGEACTDGSECCSTDCVSGICSGGESCGDFMDLCSTNADCCSGVCQSGSCTTFYPCAEKTLPAGSKKIFVTSTVYNASRFPSGETTADNYCNQVAAATKYTGTFKALTYMRGRDIASVIKSGVSFWNGKKDPTTNLCTWVPVAANMGDFFSVDGSGNYLQNPILYNEQGVAMTGNTVWTGFVPGSSSYNLINQNDLTWSGFNQTAWPAQAGCNGIVWDNRSYDVIKAYGNPESKTVAWAGNVYHPNPYYSGVANWDNCANAAHALYCIEQ